MKKEKKTYILLVVVILVWSVVGYQFFSYMEEDAEYIPEINQRKFKPNISQKGTPYKVTSHFRDPFLDTKTISNKRPTKKSTRVQKEPINFPPINYLGTIINGRKRLFLIAINGEQHAMHLKSKVNEIQLISGNSTQIKVKYKGSYKTIKK